MVKKVFKYATGVEIPEGAIYLNTKTQKINSNGTLRMVDEWLVWHYFLVDIKHTPVLHHFTGSNNCGHVEGGDGATVDANKVTCKHCIDRFANVLTDESGSKNE